MILLKYTSNTGQRQGRAVDPWVISTSAWVILPAAFLSLLEKLAVYGIIHFKAVLLFRVCASINLLAPGIENLGHSLAHLVILFNKLGYKLIKNSQQIVCVKRLGCGKGASATSYCRNFDPLITQSI